jgi:hypothetical protein
MPTCNDGRRIRYTEERNEDNVAYVKFLQRWLKSLRRSSHLAITEAEKYIKFEC